MRIESLPDKNYRVEDMDCREYCSCALTVTGLPIVSIHVVFRHR